MKLESMTLEQLDAAIGEVTRQAATADKAAADAKQQADALRVRACTIHDVRDALLKLRDALLPDEAIAY